MDLLPIGFLILVVVLGGAIAYFGDQLGRKLGKKRHSLGKLRPRHTAALLTTGAGVLIPILTILILAGVSRDFRQWVLEAPRAIAQRDGLMKEVGELKGQETRLLDRTKELEATTAARERDLRTANERLARVQQELRGFEQRTRELQAQVARYSDTIRGLNANLRRAESSLTRTRSELAKSGDRLKETRGQIDRATRDFQEVYRQREEAYAELVRMQSDNSKLAADLREVQSSLESLGKERDDLRTSINQERNAFEATLARNSEQLQAISRDLMSRQRELDDVSKRLLASQEFISRTFGPSRTQPIIFRFGEEVARVTALPGLSRVEATARLDLLLRQSRLEALSRGADAGTADFPAAGIFARNDPRTGRTIPPEEIRDAIINEVATSSRALAMVAYSNLNAFKGERVSLEVRLFENRLVYRAGEVVAEARIDGTRSNEEVLRQVSAFISTDLNEAATRDRMLPRAGTDAPFGAIPLSEIFEAVRQIRAADSSVRLQAVAKEDTRAADPLKVELRIR